MLSRLFEALYQKVFVSIVLTRSGTLVYIEHCDSKKVLQNFEKKFHTTTFDHKIYDFIQEHISETPFYYITILDSSAQQGALPTCEAREMQLYVDMEANRSLCYNNQWSYYTSVEGLDLVQKEYKDLGLDFIFSPFCLLAKIYKDKLASQMCMFILLEDNFLSLSVFDENKLLFAQRLDMDHADENDDMMIDDEDELEFDLDASINLDEVNAMDDLGELEDFSDIEDLDTLDEIDEFDESIKPQENKKKLFDDMPVADEDGFNEDYQRFLLVKSAVHTFYNDDKYESKFVEHVYIADCVGVSDDLKRYIEEEMFLNPIIRKVDLMQELCDMAKEELR